MEVRRRTSAERHTEMKGSSVSGTPDLTIYTKMNFEVERERAGITNNCCIS